MNPLDFARFASAQNANTHNGPVQTRCALKRRGSAMSRETFFAGEKHLQQSRGPRGAFDLTNTPSEAEPQTSVDTNFTNFREFALIRVIRVF
jgi:hypothetical protein